MKDLVWILCLLVSFKAGAECGPRSPAFPVEETQFTSEGVVRLWPGGFRPGRPGEQLPPDRDSTDRIGGLTVPGARSGHELFKGVDIVGDHLLVAYNAGLQVWDIGTDPERPRRLRIKDGWMGDFFWFPPVSEQLNFIEDVAGVELPDGRLLIALAGKAPVGPSVWVFGGGQLTQVYQDRGTVARSVRLEAVGGRWYLIASSDKAGEAPRAYDASRMLELGSCSDQAGSPCGVLRGWIPSPHEVSFIDTRTRGGKLYVASSGLFWPLEMWEVANPEAPGIAFQSLSLGTGYEGVAFFEVGGISYLAAARGDLLSVWEIESCFGEACSPRLVVSEVLRPGIFRSVSFSESEGAPFLHVGVEAPTGGSQLEYLFDVSGVAEGVIAEVTAGGETYTDPCSGGQVGYWSAYYPANENGLREFRPRMGKFGGRYFYRAGETVLDVHVREGEAPPRAAFTWSPQVPGEGETVSFQDQSTGLVSSWSWTFEGGQPSAAGVARPSTMFGSIGEKTVTLRVCNEGGCDTVLGTVAVVGKPPRIQSISLEF